MGFLLPQNSAPSAPPPAPPVPTIENTAAKNQDYQAKLAQRKGRAASILAGGDKQSALNAPTTAAKALLGS
jgi:hypothetical protein